MCQYRIEAVESGNRNILESVGISVASFDLESDMHAHVPQQQDEDTRSHKIML